MALATQIKNDPIMLDLCSCELSTFNHTAAELLFKHSNINSITDAELIVNFKLNQGIVYLDVGLVGIDGIHLCLPFR
jgi:hypothetical protein